MKQGGDMLDDDNHDHANNKDVHQKELDIER
jgi:hypothetical protein